MIRLCARGHEPLQYDEANGECPACRAGAANAKARMELKELVAEQELRIEQLELTLDELTDED